MKNPVLRTGLLLRKSHLTWGYRPRRSLVRQRTRWSANGRRWSPTDVVGPPTDVIGPPTDVVCPQRTSLVRQRTSLVRQRTSFVRPTDVVGPPQTLMAIPPALPSGASWLSRERGIFSYTERGFFLLSCKARAMQEAIREPFSSSP